MSSQPGGDGVEKTEQAGPPVLSGRRTIVRRCQGARRYLVVRESVLTVSDSGVKSSSLATLVERGWVAFPPPAQPQP